MQGTKDTDVDPYCPQGNGQTANDVSQPACSNERADFRAYEENFHERNFWAKRVCHDVFAGVGNCIR